MEPKPATENPKTAIWKMQGTVAKDKPTSKEIVNVATATLWAEIEKGERQKQSSERVRQNQEEQKTRQPDCLTKLTNCFLKTKCKNNQKQFSNVNCSLRAFVATTKMGVLCISNGQSTTAVASPKSMTALQEAFDATSAMLTNVRRLAIGPAGAEDFFL